jgi:hypothetical protein
VFAIVPACGGPPPGYFGPDDGGACYHVDTSRALLVDAPACFKRAALRVVPAFNIFSCGSGGSGGVRASTAQLKSARGVVSL